MAGRCGAPTNASARSAEREPTAVNTGSGTRARSRSTLPATDPGPATPHRTVMPRSWPIRCGWSIERFVRTARTIRIRAGQHILTAEDSLPADLRDVLALIR